MFTVITTHQKPVDDTTRKDLVDVFTRKDSDDVIKQTHSVDVADVVKSPIDITTNAFEKALLQCGIESSKKIIVVWYKESKRIKSQGSRISITTSQKFLKSKGMFMVRG